MDEIQNICTAKTQKYKDVVQRNGGGVICTERNFYRLLLPSMYRLPEISEDLNDVMEWVLRDHRISLKQIRNPLPPRENIIEFDFQINDEELEWNLKKKGCYE